MGKNVTQDSLKKEAIIKVFNKSEQKYTNVIIPSKLTIGAANSSFQEGVSIHGAIEFKNTSAPSNTSNKLYLDGTTLKFNGSEVGGSLTVEEEDGDPTVTPVTKIKVTNGTLTDDGSGTVTINTAGSGGSGADVGWKSGPAAGKIYTTGSLEVSLGTRTSAGDASLWVGGGYNSALSKETLYVAAGQNDDAELALFEESGGVSDGFGTSNAYGVAFVYDGGSGVNKLLIKTGVDTTVTTRASLDRTTGLFLSKRDQIYDLFWYTSSALIQFISWYDQSEKGTGIDYDGASWRQYLMAPYDGEIISVAMVSMYSSGTPPGSTSIGFWKNANPSSGTGTATASLSVDAWGTRYTTDSWTGTTTFSKGDLLSISVDPTNDARYSLLQVKIRYDELT